MAARGHALPERDALDRWARQAGGNDQDEAADKPQEDKSSDAKQKPSLFSHWWVKPAIALIVLLLIAGGIIWWLIARQYEDTDDAFIDTHIVHISPQTNGQVLRVYVTDNQFVRAGAPL